MKRFLVGILCAAAAVASGGVLAQAFPMKPIELVVPANVGAGSDIFARLVADLIAKEKLLPQPIVIINKGGGGGAIGAAHAAQKRGDPYTVVSFPTGMMLTVALRSGLDVGLDKFQPIALLGFDISCMMVNAESPYKSVQQLVDAAKAKPRTVNVSIGSTGSSSHMFVYTLERLTGARFNVVVMKSGSEALTALLGGHVHWHTGQLSDAMPHVKAGKIRILGVASEQRIAQLPAIPTMKEQGLDMHVSAGRGFSAPAAIPADALALLEGVFASVYRSAGWQDYMARNMMEPVYMNATEYGRYLAARQPEFSRFISDLGLASKK